MPNNRPAVLGALLLSLTLAGCWSQQQPEFLSDLVPVTGTVTLAGKPLAGAVVTFVPDVTSAGGRQAVGVTGVDGTYAMVTSVPRIAPERTQGIIPGTYAVTVSRLVRTDGETGPDEILSETDSSGQALKQVVPRQFTLPATTRLRATITAPSGQFDILL